MIKKIRMEELKLGMYIHDLNAGWMEHSFFWTRFMLSKEEDLLKIRASGIQDLYIDTLRGLDVSFAPTEDEVRQEIEERMLEEIQVTSIVPTPARATYREELQAARQIQTAANVVIHSVLTDARLGRQIQVEQMEPVVEQIADSVLRNQGTLVSLLRIKERDKYTFQHSVSVATLLIAFCRALDFERSDIQQAGIGGMIHDIGKMRVPDHILNKPGKLTEAEYKIMMGHVMLGMEILENTPSINDTIRIISGEHHERFNGTGYPLHLKGTKISKLGRMAAIVDVYDAITSNRVYHKGMEPAEALRKLYEWSDHHFDPELVQLFIQSIGIYPVGSLVRLDSQRIAVILEQGEKGLLYPMVRVVYDIKRGQKIKPIDVDLGTSQAASDRIVSTEEPHDWGINPHHYLTLP